MYIDVFGRQHYNIVCKMNHIDMVRCEANRKAVIKWILKSFAGKIVWSARAPER